MRNTSRRGRSVSDYPARRARTGRVCGSEELERRMLLAAITVTTTSDELDGNTASIPLLQATPGGAGISLREAIIACNNTGGADVITLPAGTHRLTRVGNDVTAVNGDLDINDSVTINGAAAATTFIQGAADAVFTGSIGDKVIGINQEGTHPSLTVSINNVTIRYGRNTIPTTDPLFAYTGGGVDVFLTGASNNISFTDCVITGNENVNAYGGGVNVDSANGGVAAGSVLFTRCTISSNRTTSALFTSTGGGVNLFSDVHNVTFTDCTITGNQAATGSATANGGGINIRHSFGGTITINNTNITNNTSGGVGGGVNIGINQTVNMTGGSISGNTSLSSGGGSANGGGIFTGATIGATTLTNATISNNHADGGASGAGGGIYNVANTTTTLINCTITGNTADSGAAAFNQSGTLNISGSRIVNNTAPTGAGVTRVAGTATVTNNWWGTHTPATLMSGTVGFNPWLVLRVGAVPNTVLAGSGATSTITADVTTNSNGTGGFGVPNPTSIPITFAGTKGNVSPGGGNLNASSTASTTWTVGSSGGAGSASATVDGLQISAAISVTPATPNAPDLQLGSDSGAFNIDNVTNAANPTFDASGVEPGATVELLRNGTSVASRTGPGALTDTGAPAGNHTYTLRQTVETITSAASNGLAVNIDRTAPATAPVPDMTAGTDNGVSSVDNVTNNPAPTFDVSTGIEANALVELRRDGNIVATRTGPGNLTPPAQAHGSYNFSARQIDLAGNPGGSSGNLSVTIDTLPPAITAPPFFNFEITQSIVYTFSENVQQALAAADIVVENLTTTTTVPNASKIINYFAPANTATLTFAGFPATLLADGNYRNTIAAAGVTDIAGNPLTATNVFNYFVLAGDADRDRDVDVNDLGILASNWQLSPRTFSQGNFDYSANGLVDVGDLGTLASNWQQQLAAPSAPAARRTPSRVLDQVFAA